MRWDEMSELFGFGNQPNLRYEGSVGLCRLKKRIKIQIMMMVHVEYWNFLAFTRQKRKDAIIVSVGKADKNEIGFWWKERKGTEILNRKYINQTTTNRVVLLREGCLERKAFTLYGILRYVSRRGDWMETITLISGSSLFSY